MTRDALQKRLSKLKRCSISVHGKNVDEDFCSILVEFSRGDKIKADYWRIIKDGKHFLSSFDHRQKYGLPAPIDAIKAAQETFNEKIISEVLFQKETGDIVIAFDDNLKLQVLNFTGYEVWEINFSDGTVEYSNYAREYT